MNAALHTIGASHIKTDAEGRAWIGDTNIKVIEVVRDHLAYGWSPEEIHWQHPVLGLAQIYAALAHYHDHRDAIDAALINSLHDASASSRSAAGDTHLTRRLRSLLDARK